MFVIQLIHMSGGSKTILGKTLAECREKAACIQSKDYVAGTIPFAVYRSKSNGIDAYDVSIPSEVRKTLGLELRLLIADGEES
jgi:hypothetical protein